MVIHGKFKGRKKEFIFLCLVNYGKVKEKWKEKKSIKKFQNYNLHLSNTLFGLKNIYVRPTTTIPKNNSLITYKVVTETKCNSHETMSSDSVGNCVSPRIEMLFHGHTITKRRHLNMIRIAKKMIPRRFLNYPIPTNHVHKKKPISPSLFAC